MKLWPPVLIITINMTIMPAKTLVVGTSQLSVCMTVDLAGSCVPDGCWLVVKVKLVLCKLAKPPGKI